MSEKRPAGANETIGHDQHNGICKHNRKQEYGDRNIKYQVYQSKESWKLHLGLRFKEPYLSIILLLIQFSGISGNLRIVPSNTIAVIGDTVRFNCSSDTLQPIFWEKIPFGLSALQQKTIYYGEHGLHSEFAPRYSVSTSNNTYDLIITKVEMSDAGKYFCIDEGGLGEQFSAELVVTEALDCVENIPPDGVMGENIFGVPQRFGRLQCSLKFRGNIEPILVWKSTQSMFTYPDSSLKTQSSILSAIAISSTEMNGAVITCQAVLPSAKEGAEFGTDAGLQWISKQVIVNYARFENQPIEPCPGGQANLICNPPCIYVVKLRATGRCICMAYYTFEKNTYANHSYSCKTDSCDGDVISSYGTTVAVIMAVVITIICCGTAIAIMLFVIWKKSKKKNKKNSTPIVNSDLQEPLAIIVNPDEIQMHLLHNSGEQREWLQHGR